MKKILLSALLFSAVVFLSPSPLIADDENSPMDLKETNSKIEQVLATQQEILKELADIRSELQILKIRVSQNQ